MDSRPIGFFDSGIGGSTIWQAVTRLLPHENTVFIADSANAPYGEKSAEQIIALSRANVERLKAFDCKLIIVACNTATTAAIATLRLEYSDLLWVGIEPAIKPAALASKTGHIGILATKGTLASTLFHQTTAEHVTARGIVLHEQIGTGIVELIESGKLYSPEMSALLERLVMPFHVANIDILVLGCTHYPYLRPQLAVLLPQVTIIDSEVAIAKQVQRLLVSHHQLADATAAASHLWLTSGEVTILRRFAPDNVEIAMLSS